MTEYWVSQAKHYCKFCKCYITDNKPSRQHHETSVRHKVNLQTFMEKQKQEKLHGAQSEAMLKRQLAEIERAAHLAMAENSYTGQPTPSLQPQTQPRFSGESDSFNSLSHRAPIIEETPEEENSGIYTIRGKTYLDGRIFENKLKTGQTCEIFVEALDDWFDAEITRRREVHVPHTNLTIATFDVKYTVPTEEGSLAPRESAVVEETGIRGDRLRILAAVVEHHDDPRLESLLLEPAPVTSADTGIGMWQTVSVREVDDEAENDAHEEAKRSMVDTMNNPAQFEIEEPTKVHKHADRDPFRDVSVKEYKGFSLEAVVSSVSNKIVADGAVVEFRKRKLTAEEGVETAESKVGDGSDAPPAVAAKAVARPRNIRKRTEE